MTPMTNSQAGTPADLENTIYMDTEHGRVIMEMRPDLAPKHVSRIKELVREGWPRPNCWKEDWDEEGHEDDDNDEDEMMLTRMKTDERKNLHTEVRSQIVAARTGFRLWRA